MSSQLETKDKFSAAEAELLEYFGIGDNLRKYLRPGECYRLAMETAFIDGEQSPRVDALRRVVVALRDNKPHRGTPEFEKLLVLCDHPWHRNPGLLIPCPQCGEEP